MKKMYLLLVCLIVVLGMDMARAVVITVHLKNGNGEYITTGATLRYFDTAWKTDAMNNGDGTWTISSTFPSLRYEMTYNSGQQIKGPLSSTITLVNFQTTKTSVKLFNSSGIALNGGNARFTQLAGWNIIGTTGYGDPMPAQGQTIPIELLPGTYSFDMEYNNSRHQSSVTILEGIPSTSVQFTTVRLTVKLQSSTGSGLQGGHPQYDQNGWNNLIVTNANGNSIIDLLPGSYTFKMVYNYTEQDQGPITISGVSQTVLFTTSAVMCNLLSSANAGLQGGVMRYYQSSWHTMGTTQVAGNTAVKELLPGKYYFDCEFNDGRQQIGLVNVCGQSQNIEFKTTNVIFDGQGPKEFAVNTWRIFTGPLELLPGTYFFRIGGKMLGQFPVSGIAFYRALVNVELRNSEGQLISSGGVLRYNDGQWKTDAMNNGDGSWSVLSTMPSAYFEMTYNHGKQQIGPVILTGPAPAVVFPTTHVTVRLENCNHDGFREGKPRYFQQIWVDLPPTNQDGNSVIDLLPGSYFFDMDFNFGRQQIGPVSVDGIVLAVPFQTTEVHLSCNGPADYYNYSWTKLTGPLDLLPGDYFFRVDGTEAGPYKISGCEMKKSLIMVKLTDHQGQALAGGTARYLTGTKWRKIGSTNPDGKVLAMINPTKMTIEMTYNYVSKRVSSHGAQDYTFRTSLVRLNLKDQRGNPIIEPNGGAASFYSPSMHKWIKIGTTTEKGCVTVELLPLTGYQFRMVCDHLYLPVVQAIVPANNAMVIDFIYPPFKSAEIPALTDESLARVYPNPFIDRINLDFPMEKSGTMEISCYNICGEKVAELLREEMPAGNHNLQWNMDLAPGTYFLRIVSEDQVWTRKIIKQ